MIRSTDPRVAPLLDGPSEKITRSRIRPAGRASPYSGWSLQAARRRRRSPTPSSHSVLSRVRRDQRGGGRMGIRVTVSTTAPVLCLRKNALGHRSRVDAPVFTGLVGSPRSQWAHEVAARLASLSGVFFVGFLYGLKFFHFGWTELIGKNYAGLRAFWAKFHALL
jgi:hypothetical protein